MYDELKNFQKFGTKDFVVSGSLNTNNNDKSAKITRITMNKALTRFENAAKSYAKYDPEFANKVNGFVWEQRTANKKYLENKPLYDNERELLEKTRKLRADLNGVKYDESAEIADFQNGIGGENGKLAQLRKKHKDAQLILGSKKYDRVGDVLKWLDDAYKVLEKTEKEATQSKNKDDAYTYTPWLGKLTNVKEYLETLKDATSGYFAHKNKDGQWNGSNKNANKRIGVVREIDEFADSMLDMINKKSLLIAKKLDACKNKGEVLADEVKDPQPKAEVKPDPEELFKQHKEAFANEAAEIWLKNKFISYINEKINATHEDYDEQARQQIIADNAGKMNEYIAQNMEALKNDAAFKSFMDRIEKEGDIEKMRQYASADNGSKLYRIINGDKIIENEIIDLDKKILTAQAELTGEKAKLPDNEYPNPGHKENFESYTTIITAYYIKAHKQEFGDNVTNETFDNMKETIKGKKVTRSIIQNMKPEDLYKKASNDKGQNIWSEYNTKLTKYNERKNAVHNNNANDLNKTTGVVDNQNGNNLNGTIVNNNTIVIGK